MSSRPVNATIEGLAAAIDELDVAVDADELVAVHGLLDRLQARVATADAAFDRVELWDTTGATSMTRWLVTECRLTPGSARRAVRTARTLAALPVLTDAFTHGEVSGGQVELVVQAVTPRRLGLMVDHEPALVPTWAPLDIDATTDVLTDWAERADAIPDGTAPEEPRRTEAHLHRLLGAHTRLDAHLVGDDAAIVTEAIRLARRGDEPDETRTRAMRDGDALVELCRRALRDHRHPRREPGRQRPGVNLVIDAYDHTANHLRARGLTPGDPDGFERFLDQHATTPDQRAWWRAGWERLHHPHAGTATTLTGVTLSPSLTAALTCDATLRHVLTAGSEILHLGRAAPTVPRAIRHAIHLRDRLCRFRGCDRTIDWCEIHHLHHREHGGVDSLHNCVLLCARHHHVLHRPGWHTHMSADGTLTVTPPNQPTWTTHPPGPTNRPPPQPPPPDPLTYGA